MVKSGLYIGTILFFITETVVSLSLSIKLLTSSSVIFPDITRDLNLLYSSGCVLKICLAFPNRSNIFSYSDFPFFIISSESFFPSQGSPT